MAMGLGKVELQGPTTCLTFLGIELDTVAMEARLPTIQLLEFQQLVVD